MDSFPPNVQRIATAPFSLDAARLRHVPDADYERGPTASDSFTAPAAPAVRGPRRHPRLELVAGSAIPDATPAQVTDARDRFLGRLRRDLAAATVPFPAPGGASAQPSMTLMRRIPRLLPPRDGGPGCA